MRRRPLLGSGLALTAALAACATGPSVVEVIDRGTLPRPLTPALIVVDVALPPALPERDAREVLAREAVRAGIGERPTADPAADQALAANARSRGLPRVVLMTVVQATRFREAPLAPVVTEVAIRVRVLDARSGAEAGQATYTARSTEAFARRGTGDLAGELTALAAGLLA